ncbi:FERM domain-containing protein 5-like isoform X2 [Saccostrea echinata]|uniref:FERM domain-containing protein 5-like isoform X2 n=1 Tax=Saccostrea echinata TaxID=191078 RepID=UPI002A7F7BF8|nr:FERM domain-containing protein 5-like isoform X2 [Saccostrea echinata]
MFRKKSVKGDVHTEYQCSIRFLDDSEPLSLSFKKDTHGQELFDQVCNKLNLVEKDYFGLRYVEDKQRHWLDPLKSVYKQLKGVNPCVLCFRVKFYPSDPSKLHEEITRYYLFLQLRRDLHHGRLLCSQADALVLAAYIIQSEVGDYDPEDHPPGYVSEFKMLPKQNAKMEEEIMEIHKTLAGQVPAEAEANFLKKAATLDTYGVDPHQVKDQKGVSLYLGVTHQGIMTFHGSRRTQLYKWSQIKKMPTYEGKTFILHVSVAEDEDQANNKKKQKPIGYKCDTLAACKYLWKCAVEQQLFFTLQNSAHPPKLRSGHSLFSRGSKFRFSGRCQNEAFAASEEIKRNEPNFNRTSSLPNYGRKPESKNSPNKHKSMTLEIPIKEDKRKYRVNKGLRRESAVDVPSKEPSIMADIVQQAPVTAPVATPEDSIVSEVVEPEKITATETEPLKQNGSLPAIVLNSESEEMPPYEPNHTVIEEQSPVKEGKGHQEISDSDEEEEVKKPSLEEQLKDLEEEIERKSSFSGSYQPEADVQEEVILTTVPKSSNNVQSSPHKQNHLGTSTKSTAVEPTSTGSGCCRMFLFTFFFVFLTLTVTAIALLSSNLDHPLLTQLRQHLQFVNPVRDYVMDRINSFFS